MHCSLVLCVEGSLKNGAKEVLKPQLLIFVRNISYENKRKAENNIGKRRFSSWVAGRSREVGGSPEEHPVRLDEPRSISPRCKPKCRCSVCCYREAWD